jgi:hypothetical protein
VLSCLRLSHVYSVENREAFREIGGLEKLVEFACDPSQKDMHVNCLNALSNCLEDTECLGVSELITRKI